MILCCVCHWVAYFAALIMLFQVDADKCNFTSVVETSLCLYCCLQDILRHGIQACCSTLVKYSVVFWAIFLDHSKCLVFLAYD